MSWRDLQHLPRGGKLGWAIHKSGKEIPCAGLEEVTHRLRGWSPLSSLLVAGPDDTLFLPPIYNRELRPALLSQIRRNVKLSIVSWLVLSLMVGLLSRGERSPQIVESALLACVASMIGLDYRLALGNPAGLGERALFFRWLQADKAPRRAFSACLVLMLLAGTIQCLAQSRLGGHEALVTTYGIYFPAVRAGQWWRLASGVFLHASLLHFLNNLFSILFIAPIVWGTISAAACIGLFSVGCLVGPVVQMLEGSPNFDSYLGISSGIFAMFGVQIAQSLRRRRLLPKGFNALLLSITLLSGIFMPLMSSATSVLGHLAGLAAGLVFGLMRRPPAR